MAYYVICDDDCKYEGMTREQILTAIEQAVEQGYVSDPDSAVFSKMREMRAGAGTQIWVGTEAEFNALSPAPEIGMALVRVGTDGILYMCSDDSTLENFDRVFEQMQTINEHIASEENPHNVTAEQIGAATDDHTHTLESLGIVVSATEPTNPTEGMIWIKIEEA